MKILCFGDVHLGQGAEYGRKPGDRLADQDDVLQRIADVASEREVDGVLCAGDVFEGPTLPPEQLDVFARFVARCRESDVPLLTITGNSRHDLASRGVNGLAIFSHVAGITVSDRPDVYRFAGCAVGTLPWVSPARMVATRNGGDRDELHADVAAMLVDIARGLKEDCERVAPGSPHVLLAHWSVSGSSLPNGLPVDQLREPALPLTELEPLGFDAVVLGHIHQEQLLATDPAEPVMPIFYVGSPLPLNFGEARSRHGVWILEFLDGEPDFVQIPEFVPIPSPPFVTIDEHLSVHDRYGLECACLASDVSGAIVRVRLTGTSDEMRGFDLAALRSAILAAGAAFVKVVPEIVRQDRARVAGLDEQVGELDALEQWMLAQGIVGVDEPWELAEPTDVLADAMRAKTAAYLETV